MGLADLRVKLADLYGGVSTMLSPNRSSRGGAKVIGAVIHTTEGLSFDGVVAYLRNPSVEVSSHYVVARDDDPQSIGRKWVRVARLVPENEKAWTAKSANPHFVQYELCGFARTSREDWLCKYMKQIETTAALVAEDCVQYGFPARRGVPGIVGHRDLAHFGYDNDHTDPGTEFPWDVFLKCVKHFMEFALDTPTPQPVPAAPANETCFQYAQRVTGTQVGGSKPPSWVWKWNAWLNSGRKWERPVDAPARIPDWAWAWRECIHGVSRHEDPR
jgi:N-acetyl-anhydromuramyl-L-alanine amidase AmpD